MSHNRFPSMENSMLDTEIKKIQKICKEGGFLGFSFHYERATQRWCISFDTPGEISESLLVEGNHHKTLRKTIEATIKWWGNGKRLRVING